MLIPPIDSLGSAMEINLSRSGAERYMDLKRADSFIELILGKCHAIPSE